MRIKTFTLLLPLMCSACTILVGDTPTDTASPRTVVGSSPSATAGGEEVDCVRFAGDEAPVATGSLAGDALALSNEVFACADDVVVVSPRNLNELAAGAQLAAALGGPILFPGDQLGGELSRLNPLRIYAIGQVDVEVPPTAELKTLSIGESVDAAKEVLGVTEEIRLPAAPDESTIVETVGAIIDGDRVVIPQTSPAITTTTAPSHDFDEDAIVSGLAVPRDVSRIWMTDIGHPAALLVAAATGRSADAAPIAYDADDMFRYPEVSDALEGRWPDQILFVGKKPKASRWQLSVLINGLQVPGGGFEVFPAGNPRRYVAFYGHPETSGLGALGEQGPKQTLDRMEPYLRAYEGDGRQTVATFEMLASVASAAETDGDYSLEFPIETYERWIEVARKNDMYVMLDLQPGRDDFLNQAKQYEELLKLPFVGLALDPEWRLGPGQIHLQQIGRVDSSEVNRVVRWLARLVRENGLPQKMVIVHQFRDFMIENRSELQSRPQLQMVIQMDGDGPEFTKDDTYAFLTRGTEDADWVWGWKNFFDEDEPAPPTPESTMGKDPVPVYVSYQ